MKFSEMPKKQQQGMFEHALTFLSRRNPTDADMSQSEYVFMLLEMAKTHGDESLLDLAGYYLYCLAHKVGENCTHAIQSVFAHDLNGRNDQFMLPRSHGFGETFLEEFYPELKPSFLV